MHGDQPSLLISLISWAETLGITVLGAGKSSEYDFVCDLASHKVSWRGQTKQIPGLSDIWPLAGSVKDSLARRADLLSVFPQRTVPDLCEMGIVCNHTALRPDRPAFHAPHARVTELCDLFALHTDGGIVNQTPFIDVFNCMRRPDEQSFGGGVFVIVDTQQDDSWEILREKGICISQDGRRGLLYNPSHLLGVEAAISVMSTVWLDKPTGSQDIRHVVDLHARANRDWSAGEVLAITDHHHHEIDGLSAELHPAALSGTKGPLPYYMAAGNRLAVDVKAGSVITTDMVIPPQGSTLWQLRHRMEADLSADSNLIRTETLYDLFAYLRPHNLTSSSLCFRTMQFGAGASETDSAEMYQDCRAAGINFFDTAYVYTDGKSEQFLGRLIASERDQIILVTKAGAVGGLSAQTIRTQLEVSLKRLNQDYADIFFLHRFDEDTPLEETLKSFCA